MGTETEVKVIIENIEDFCHRLEELAPTILSPRHFEDNHLLDFPDQRLGSSQCLLRVRSAADRHYLTFKGPPRPEGIFKTREELETTLQDGTVLLEVLERIGMRVSFRYQKYRQEYAWGEVHIAVDETPIGTYVEFEGTETGIRDLAQKMSIAETQFLRASYYSLYVEHCRLSGATPGFMVF